jgi:RNA polymerase sigma factor (sigma-70 family)
MRSNQDQAGGTSILLLERYRDGDESAAGEIFARYFERLTALARRRLSARVARRTDPEDVVLSVYRSFFIRARDGRFTLSRGGDLWRLLASITRHKLLRQVRHDTAERRSVDLELPIDRVGEGSLAGREPGPSHEEAVALADELERVLAQLTPFGRRVLELRLQGLELVEIADDTGRSERTVRRTLGEIRSRLAERLDHVGRRV